MRVAWKKWMIGAVVFPVCVHAGEEGWSGKGELGMVFARGNTETETLNGSLNFAYDKTEWQYKIGGSVLRASDKDKDTAKRYEVTGKVHYSMAEKSYLFTALRYEDDEFSGFDYRASLAAGYGRKFIDTNTHKLSAEVGLGTQSRKESLTGEKDTHPIGRGHIDYTWKLTDSTEFSNTLLIESGVADEANTYIENKTGLSVAIDKALALKVGFEYRRNSEVPEGRDNTDTISSVNIVYNF
ncbi:MAG: DUF481 domain-containing protein [Gammaproteobacteria bacterium]|nr:DUF481 domain-containing protein [Gammaproteobacteria bacterium]